MAAHGWLTPCEIVQRLQRLGILEQHGTIDLFQFLTTFSQKLVEVTDSLLIGTYVGSAHLEKSSIDTFERVQVLGQSDLGRSGLRSAGSLSDSPTDLTDPARMMISSFALSCPGSSILSMCLMSLSIS